MKEIWKDIEGYEGVYQVSSLGRVRSLNRIDSCNHKREGVVLRPSKLTSGYLVVSLYSDGNRKNFKIHRLVASAFKPNTAGKPCVNHINHKKDDNRVGNLEWCTYKENTKSAVKHGQFNGLMKKVFQVDPDTRNVVSVYKSTREAAIFLGGCNSTISKCCLGKIKSYRGFIWLFSLSKLNDRVNDYKNINNGKPKTVLQICANTMKVIGSYNSTKDAAVYAGVSSSNISACCRGDQKTAAGYKWKYI